MKEAVLELVREFGSPEIWIKQQKEEEEMYLKIKEYLKLGKMRKEIAKELGMTVGKLISIMKKHNLLLRDYKNKRKKKNEENEI